VVNEASTNAVTKIDDGGGTSGVEEIVGTVAIEARIEEVSLGRLWLAVRAVTLSDKHRPANGGCRPLATEIATWNTDAAMALCLASPGEDRIGSAEAEETVEPKWTPRNSPNRSRLIRCFSLSAKINSDSNSEMSSRFLQSGSSDESTETNGKEKKKRKRTDLDFQSLIDYHPLAGLAHFYYSSLSIQLIVVIVGLVIGWWEKRPGFHWLESEIH